MLKNEDTLFLGVATHVGVRSDHDKELDRVNLAHERIQVLGHLRLGFENFCAYVRLFGMSAVSYGWISRLPTKTCCNKLWTAVKKGHQRVKMSNQWLRGGLLHLDVLVACNLSRLIAALEAAGQIVWHSRVGLPLGTSRRWMKTCGFEEDSPWSWRMSGVRVSLFGNIKH